MGGLSLEQQLTTQLIPQQDMTSKNYGLHAMTNGQKNGNNSLPVG